MKNFFRRLAKISPFSTPPLLGVDIQPDKINLMQLKKIKTIWHVECIASKHFPKTIAVQGKINDWQTGSVFLTELVKTLNLAGMAAAICLPAHLVMMQRLRLPRGLSHAAITTELEAYIRQHAPGFAKTITIDFMPVSMSVRYAEIKSARALDEAADDLLDIFFTATCSTYLSEYIACLQTAGLQVKIVDVDVYALKRIFSQALSLAQQQEMNALLYANDDSVTYLVFDYHEVLFYQQWQQTEMQAGLTALLNEQQKEQFSLLSVKRLLVCPEHKTIASALTAVWPWPLYEVEPWQYLNGYQQAVQPNHVADFLLAGGLAMRQVVSW
ncbi:MAG TPA: pilus assembly protein PilM [Gammaproteobacteria bacterium]|nr:pilus assembly protein PilM [Gammaproteobacteria bacterium]